MKKKIPLEGEGRQSMWTDCEGTSAEENEAGLLVGHKLSTGQQCTSDTKVMNFLQGYVRNDYSFF